MPGPAHWLGLSWSCLCSSGRACSPFAHEVERIHIYRALEQVQQGEMGSSSSLKRGGSRSPAKRPATCRGPAARRCLRWPARRCGWLRRTPRSAPAAQPIANGLADEDAEGQRVAVAVVEQRPPVGDVARAHPALRGRGCGQGGGVAAASRGISDAVRDAAEPLLFVAPGGQQDSPGCLASICGGSRRVRPARRRSTRTGPGRGTRRPARRCPTPRAPGPARGSGGRGRGGRVVVEGAPLDAVGLQDPGRRPADSFEHPGQRRCGLEGGEQDDEAGGPGRRWGRTSGRTRRRWWSCPAPA